MRLTPEEFKLCFDRYFDAIRNYLYFRGGNTELASDLAQEVFLKLWEKQMEFDPIQTKGLLYKMAGDLFISHLRKNIVADKHLDSIRFDLNANRPDASLQFRELKANYERSLTALPEKQRTVFLMNRMEELTYKEIAARLDLSVKAVEKRMSLALTELKKNLGYHAGR